MFRPQPVPPARTRLPRGALAAGALGGVVLLAMLGTLIAVFLSLERSRSEIESTRAHLVEIDRRTDRAATALTPVLDATRPLTTAPGRRELATTFDAVTAAADRVPALADDTRAIVAIAAHVDRALTRAGIATAVPEIRRLIASQRDLLVSQRRLTERSVRVQLRTLGVSRETERLLRASLGVQRETLGHARSLDAKVPDPSGATGRSGPAGGPSG